MVPPMPWPILPDPPPNPGPDPEPDDRASLADRMPLVDGAPLMTFGRRRLYRRVTA
jgi:hypothetical protein